MKKKHVFFTLLFTIYVFGGLCISYPVAFNKNIFFGADNYRAFLDLTDITYNHYRIKVHPLFLLLTETFFLILNGFINHPAMSVIVLESLCASISVLFFYEILRKQNVGKLIRLIFSAVYAFSFSMLIFSTIPETFIFANLGLIGYWYFVLSASDRDGNFTKEEIFLLVFGGIVNFGITLTNYCSYLVGTIYLITCRYKRKSGIKSLIMLNAANGIVIFTGCIFQKFIWRQSPLFWSSIIEGICGQGYEETSYMSWQISLHKTVLWIKQVFMYPLFSPNLHMRENSSISFSGYGSWGKALILLFGGIFITSLIFLTVRVIKNPYQKADRYSVAAFAAYMGNLALHYVYGSNEAFIYSPHYLFLALAVMAVGVSSIPYPVCQKMITALLSVFLIAQVRNNVIRFFETTTLALNWANSGFSWRHSLKGALLCGGILLFVQIIYSNLFKSGLEEDYDTTLRHWCKKISLLIMLGGITGLFVAFHY